ncbi:hypothetical protein J5N97_027454 [Dioscorea zingiberensis]|uniref:Uncharacterized protein n=1 Tax=Dioscorea zingiberensis TaxID=325984 RepID=A0A9D5H7M4_9LILI|nr:hypothetical protein J5N97_027454 [Dioscorea zingiberensis]
MGVGPSIEEDMQESSNRNQVMKKTKTNELPIVMQTSMISKEEPKNASFKKETSVTEASTNGQANKAMGETMTKRVPHMHETLMKHADPGSLQDHINSGIFLNNTTKKYWVDQETGCNCFMLFPKDLSITWGEDTRYWQWFRCEDTRETSIEEAHLVNVCWLEIHGKFNTSLLTPKTKYEVVFIVKMKELSYGWYIPVNLRLSFEDGVVQQHKENLQELPREEWRELKVGEIMNNGEKSKEVEFSLFEYEGGQWKRGLVIKGVIIRPKK